MIFCLEKVKRDNVRKTFGVIVTIELLEHGHRSCLRIGHATTVGEGTERVTGAYVGDKIVFTETVKSGSRINDDATWGKDGLGLSLVQLDGWTRKLEQLCSSCNDKRAGCCIMSFLFAFDAFDLSADVVGWLPGWH